MTVLDSRAARVIVTVLVFATVLAFVYAARRTLVMFLFAIFFAYVVDPLVERLQAWVKVSRGKAIGIVYLAIFGGLGLFLLLVGPRLASEGSKLAHSVPALYQKISSGQIAWQLGAQHGWSRETEARVQDFLQQHQDSVVRWASHFASRVAQIGSNAWWLLLIPILAVFFLRDGRRFADDVVELLERRRQRQFANDILQDINAMLAHFIRAQMTLAVLSLIAYTIILLVMRMPFAVLLGVLGGFLEFIPIVGPLVAAVLILGIALATGFKHVLILGLVLGAWRVLQDYYNAPRIMGSRVELHPLATLFGILVGAEIAGVVGVYLSIPAIATVRILWRRWRAYQMATDHALLAPEETGATRGGHAA